MPIDPEKIKGGRDGHQINVRVSQEAKQVLGYMAFVDKRLPSSPGRLVMDLIRRAIEDEAPLIRQVLNQPEYKEIDMFAQVLSALDEICPVEEQ